MRHPQPRAEGCPKVHFRTLPICMGCRGLWFPSQVWHPQQQGLSPVPEEFRGQIKGFFLLCSGWDCGKSPSLQAAGAVVTTSVTQGEQILGTLKDRGPSRAEISLCPTCSVPSDNKG